MRELQPIVTCRDVSGDRLDARANEYRDVSPLARAQMTKRRRAGSFTRGSRSTATSAFRGRLSSASPSTSYWICSRPTLPIMVAESRSGESSRGATFLATLPTGSAIRQRRKGQDSFPS